ncbi:MAG TPA: 50S ribosomal protein L37ae [Candidatus Nanoarchaeia archaeon]|nr:50S ribosomal protein L37ae [Candidatus Nanoarchaeia archaeon]
MKDKTASTKRFGARYGAPLRKKVGAIEARYRSRQKCPYCRKIGVKRIAAGIWECRKCDAKFTGKAYEI